jgi:beta-lactamase class A
MTRSPSPRLPCLAAIRSSVATGAGLALVLALGGCSTADAGAGEPTRASSSSPEAPTPTPTAVTTTVATDPELDAALAELESRYGARVGLSVVDTGTGTALEHRGDERFLYASTLKALAAAALLDATEPADLDEVITWTAADVAAAGYSPATDAAVDTGLTLGELAEAAVRQSDNTALDLVLEHLGGPAALDAALAAQGDDVIDVVHTEPELNRPTPGSTADTTTPAAFRALLTRVVAGDWLDDGDRAQLLDWMSGNATGDALVRAGAPEGWTVADKSGGAGPVRDDVAVVTRPGGAPVVIAVLTTRTDPAAAYDDALVAEAARAALAAISRA